MKISNQSIEAPKLKAGIDKDIRPALTLAESSLFLNYRLYGPAAGSSHGDYTFSILFCFIDEVCCGLRHIIMFGMHFVVLYLVLTDRTEGAQSNMQSDKSQLDPFLLNPL